MPPGDLYSKILTLKIGGGGGVGWMGRGGGCMGGGVGSYLTLLMVYGLEIILEIKDSLEIQKKIIFE